MNPEDRQKLAYDLRQSGMIWKDVGKRLGRVTASRAITLARIYEHKIKITAQASTEWEKNLAVRLGRIDVINRLRNLGLLKNPRNIARISPQKLLEIKNINRKSLLIIASVLQDFGYIEDATLWIGNRSRKTDDNHPRRRQDSCYQ